MSRTKALVSAVAFAVALATPAWTAPLILEGGVSKAASAEAGPSHAETSGHDDHAAVEQQGGDAHAAPDHHLAEGWPHGLFFTLLGAFGLVWASLLRFNPGVPLLSLGLAVNIGAMALRAVSRTAGLPFGPHGSAPEEIGVLDVAAGLAELTTVTAIVLLPTYNLGPDR